MSLLSIAGRLQRAAGTILLPVHLAGGIARQYCAAVTISRLPGFAIDLFQSFGIVRHGILFGLPLG
ncbi:hypothetical protein, partial [Agrobacterium tumefaciens]|uniref:hypothetical protein n=1 Tax=Agrobacterium tumefaciens TaxID=358 RepID=UPI003B9DEDF6